LKTEVDERPSSDDPSKVVQTFSVQYRKPFIGDADLKDVSLWPEQEYNITSAYGCYLKSDDTTEGYDGNVLQAKDASGTFIGCSSHW
jgi:hypothetical protein